MKAEKTKNGYRVRKMYRGKTYMCFFDHKPTQKEMMLAMSARLEDVPDYDDKSFEDYAIKTIESKRNVVSPSTVRTYYGIIKNIPSTFKAKPLADITQADVQICINEYAINHSPRSAGNMHGFISSVFRQYRPEVTLRTTLPQKVAKEEYIPSEEDVKRILEMSEGTRYELVFQLAILGLRRGESLAINPQTDILSDKDGNRLLRVNKTLVLNERNEYEVKPYPKTEESTREIYIPAELADKIIEQGYIFKGNPHTINESLHRYQDKLGIPRFKLHNLRKYYASYAHAIGIPDKYIMKAGGWKSDNVLKNVYQRAMKDKEIEMEKYVIEKMQESLKK